MEIMQQKISAQNLAEEIFALVKEEFIAVSSQEENNLQLQFFNGQAFKISIEELI